MAGPGANPLGTGSTRTGMTNDGTMTFAPTSGGGVGDPTTATAPVGMPTNVPGGAFKQATAPGNTNLVTNPNAGSPTGSSFNYFALSPLQQQAYLNGTLDMRTMQPMASSTPTPGVTPAAPTSATNASGFVNVPFGSGTSTPVSPSSEYASALAYQNSPMMTPAAIANQNAVAAAGDPNYGTNVMINGQSVPYNSLTQTQATMLQYYNSTGQALPANFLSTYAGPNTAANAGYTASGTNNQASVTPYGTLSPTPVPSGALATGGLQNGSAATGIPQGMQLPATQTQTGNYVPYTGTQTTPYGSQTLAQTATGQTPPVSGTTPTNGSANTGSQQSLQDFMTGLLMSALFGNGGNSSANQNNIVTEPLGYTQYQGTPTSTNSSSDINSIMPYIAAMMMGMFGYGTPQQQPSGGQAGA